jgi:hypothetical protein
MADHSDAQSEGQRHPFSHWGSLPVEVLSYNIHVGTNIADYWRHVAEIQVAAFLAIAASPETPTGRRRKFRVIDGGRVD